MADLGYDPTGAERIEDDVRVETDIFLPIDQVLRRNEAFRARYFYDCDAKCGPSGTLRVWGDGLTQEWQTSLENAVAEWSSAGAPVRLASSKSQSNAVVKFGTIAPNFTTPMGKTSPGAAEFPKADSFISRATGGKLYMVINEDYELEPKFKDLGTCDLTRANARNGLLLHEIGHWLGFAHHDNADFDGDFEIDGTDRDAPSVMKIFCMDQSESLTTDDKLALSKIYGGTDGTNGAPSDCTDVPPPDGVPCSRRKSWGNCDERWLEEAGYCRRTCGRCTSGNSSGCSDVQPPGDYSCSQQASWGKCDEGWMTQGGYCEATCGRCGGTCSDIAPDDRYTCSEQAGWGKCNEPWMIRGNYCRRTCGAC